LPERIGASSRWHGDPPCFTGLREAGMALEAIQAQAGHASIESTRLYLHLASG
jgi:integrase